MKTRKPVICFDLDGTLVDEHSRIHPRDVEILSRPDPPAVFIPCTGRLLPSVRRLFARHGLFSDAPLPFPLVLQNGAALYRPGEELFAYHAFPPEVRRFFVDRILVTPGVSFLVFTQHETLEYWPTDFSRRLVQRFDLEVQQFTTQNELVFSKVMALSEYPERLAIIARLAARQGIEHSYSLETVLEFTPAGVHKGRGLGELLAGLGLEEHPLLVAGDGGNDLSMFELTPHTFAPLTAPEEIRSRACRVVDVAASGLLEPMLEGCGGFAG